MRTTSAVALAVLLLLATGGWSKEEKSTETKTPKKEVPSTAPAPEEKEKGPSVWMKIKLKSTQNILRGLSLGDFDLIEENASRMRRFGRIEQVVHGKDDAYQTQFKFFDHATNALVQQSKEKNLDGATLAFVQLTTSCVNCHRTIRDREGDDRPVLTKWTHRVKSNTEFYSTGPQQGRPADGKLAKGELVRLIKNVGSYSQVRTEEGKVVFVASDAIAPIKKKSP